MRVRSAALRRAAPARAIATKLQCADEVATATSSSLPRCPAIYSPPLPLSTSHQLHLFPLVLPDPLNPRRSPSSSPIAATAAAGLGLNWHGPEPHSPPLHLQENHRSALILPRHSPYPTVAGSALPHRGRAAMRRCPSSGRPSPPRALPPTGMDAAWFPGHTGSPSTVGDDRNHRETPSGLPAGVHSLFCAGGGRGSQATRALRRPDPTSQPHNEVNPGPSRFKWKRTSESAFSLLESVFH
jgi:hypothetical protein